MQSSMYQFKNFISRSYPSFSQGELKFASLILEHFPTIKAKGTAAGARAKFISTVYAVKDYPIAVKENLEHLNDESNLKQLSSMEVEGFRGFTTSETFDLSKKYNFLYGPNGTGKSSFCEALEYSLTGKISEAESKNFTISKYIKNMYSAKPSVVLNVQDSTGASRQLLNPKSENDFMFIERNRIEGFARVSSYTASAQQQRLSMLFGLESFNSFCNGFSDSINNYIDFKTPVLDRKNDILKNIEQLNSQKKIIENEQIRLNEKKQRLLVRYPSCKLASELISHLDPESGAIHTKQEELYRYKNIKLHDVAPYTSLLRELVTLSGLLEEYEKARNEILASSSKVEFINLYNSIQAIDTFEEVAKDSCPACDTPLTQVTSDPFAKAKKQLLLLQELASKQELQRTLQRKVESITTSCNQQFKNLSLTVSIDPTLYHTNYGYIFKNIPHHLTKALDAVKDKKELLKKENESNKPLIKDVERLNKELHVLNEDLAAANQLKALFKKNHRELTNYNSQIGSLSKSLTELEPSLKLEQIQLAENHKFSNDYASFVSKLKAYNIELPSVLAQSLSGTVLELYNLINKHPYDHEILRSLSLPKASNEKIEIEFVDGSTDDALRILSEGHLRCLGLSILLAKNIHDKHNVIVFDDVVNAIDDEHRTGVLDAIFTYPPLADKQYVITTHGEDFLKRLENQIPSKLVKSQLNRYDFKRNFSQRTILVSSDDFRQYLVKAIAALNDGKIKDALMESRRSLEGQVNRLWKQIQNQKLDSRVGVKLLSPSSHPDLYSVVTGLIKSLKEFEKKPGIDTYKPIKELLMQIQDTSKRHNENWQLLNKGTHEEDRNEEFDDNQATELIALLQQLESEIANYKTPNQVIA